MSLPMVCLWVMISHVITSMNISPNRKPCAVYYFTIIRWGKLFGKTRASLFKMFFTVGTVLPAPSNEDVLYNIRWTRLPHVCPQIKHIRFVFSLLFCVQAWFKQFIQSLYHLFLLPTSKMFCQEEEHNQRKMPFLWRTGKIPLNSLNVF